MSCRRLNSDMAMLHTIPITSRSSGKAEWLQAIAFEALFLSACLIINATQFLIVPLYFLPGGRKLYEDGMRYTKASFGLLCVLISQIFAPTNIIMTCDPGDEQKLAELIVRDDKNVAMGLNLPKKLVIISNHQIYADWLYLWCFTYFMGFHADIFIILKNSLKWVPVFGWGMQFFRFIFLSRSWATDRNTLKTQLSDLARQNIQDSTEPFSLILFPEGTLVTGNTRPSSKKYADKLGISDTIHTLLPRTTGLHTTLLTLSQIPSLYLLDITLAFPGVPRGAYPENYYTLRSIFFSGIPPPSIHLHFKLFEVASEVPIGLNRSVTNKALSIPARIEDPTEEEKAAFEAWIQNRWRRKDELMETFLQTGKFVKASSSKPVVLPIRLRSNWEVLDIYCWFIPVVAYFVWRHFS